MPRCADRPPAGVTGLEVRTARGWVPLQAAPGAPRVFESRDVEIRGAEPGARIRVGPTAIALDATGCGAIRPVTDPQLRGHVGLVEVTLSLPAGGQVNHEPPPGFRYWRGDLLQTRQGLAWSGASEAEVRWYLLRESGATLPATLEVRVNGQVLAVSLEPATPAATSVPVE